MKQSRSSVRTPEEEETYADVYIEQRSLEKSTERSVRTAWRAFEDFLSKHGYEIESFDRRQADQFLKYIQSERGVSPNTAKVYLRNLSKMVSWFIDRGEFEYNPFAMVLEDSRLDYDKTTIKREIPIDKLREMLYEMHPQWFAICLTLLKTGLRIGEVLNLDERDVHIDHPISEMMDDPRSKIKDTPDSLYVDSSVSEGGIHNGEKRTSSNKPNSYRTIPIDQELKDTLVWYIAMSPPSPSSANPIFRNNMKAIGTRYKYSRVCTYIRRVAKEHGVWEEDRSGFSAHWCRHWFTTMLRSNIDATEVPVGTVEGYVGGLRGDTGGGVIGTYTHEWRELIESADKSYREVYEDNIPKLLTEVRLSNYQ